MKNDHSKLDEAITRLLDEMAETDQGGDEYDQLVCQLERLHKMKLDAKPDRVDRATMYTIAGNLAGIMIIVGYERAAVITSKAFNMIGPKKTTTG